MKEYSIKCILRSSEQFDQYTNKKEMPHLQPNVKKDQFLTLNMYHAVHPDTTNAEWSSKRGYKQ